ncbi:MAG: class I SAM-dependent methyltransferase, partial [Roseicyclus sp.]
MLRAGIYRRMYKLSLEQGHGNVIDIGVGRGGSSIAFALGILHSRRQGRVHVIDQFTQVRAGPHLYSESTYPVGCREANTRVFLDNMRRYAVEPLVAVYPGTTDEVAPRLDPDLEADILSIDADGNIDRDLGHFFDRVALGGWVIIDDCADLVNRNGVETLARHAGRPREEVRADIAAMPGSGVRQLLGKHLLSFELAAVMERAGALVKKEVVGRTAFFVKTTSRSFAELALDFGDVEQIVKARFLQELDRQGARATAPETP